ncbi:hypothetical protein PR003_g10397 [Phytophthora rubi]|uniref:Transposase Tc1-like domain-containing protein n=1 Tax=Phytophthora rubi TaxID=129364 RepID=A0A6A4FBD9_9STRA|nr:hypothetical protein PR003_g10397 [Phytophthora rubi]
MPRTIGQADIAPEVRLQVSLFLAQRSIRGRLLRGAIAAAMKSFGLCRNSITKIWAMRTNPRALMAPGRRQPKRGRHLSPQEVAELVQAAPLCQRQTRRALAEATGISRTTLQRHLADGVLRRAVSRVKPTLTDAHKTRCPVLSNASHDTVHVDEKWFNLYKGATKYYLTAAEQLPYRSCPNKRYIGKIMFLAAVARPRYDCHRKVHFDGKIGIWPIVEETTAQRSSVNRPKGAPVTKSVSMTRVLYRKLLVDKVLPAIRAKLPVRRGTTVFVQQDNAGPHVREDDTEVETAGKYRKATYDTNGLIEAVQEAFDEVKWQTLDKCFVTLQKVMEAILLDDGSNSFKLPRVGRNVAVNGRMPLSVKVSQDAVTNGYSKLYL